jgi:hypothetical protein
MANTLSHEELAAAAKPLLDILYTHFDPHTTIIMDQAHIEIVRGEMVTPFELRD